MNEQEIIQRQLDQEDRKIDSAFLGPDRDDKETIIGKHLQAEELLDQIKYLLLGYEYNDETQSYEKTREPLIDVNYASITIGYLRTFLNSNVFLSKYTPEQINNVMWDVKIKLTYLMHPLQKVYGTSSILMIQSMIWNSIFSALNRSEGKNTLDAITKMQHSIEHVGTGNAAQKTEEQKKPFKAFGF